jgi:hypothetical protein
MEYSDGTLPATKQVVHPTRWGITLLCYSFGTRRNIRTSLKCKLPKCAQCSCMEQAEHSRYSGHAIGRTIQESLFDSLQEPNTSTLSKGSRQALGPCRLPIQWSDRGVQLTIHLHLMQSSGAVHSLPHTSLRNVQEFNVYFNQRLHKFSIRTIFFPQFIVEVGKLEIMTALFASITQQNTWKKHGRKKVELLQPAANWHSLLQIWTHKNILPRRQLLSWALNIM